MTNFKATARWVPTTGTIVKIEVPLGAEQEPSDETLRAVLTPHLGGFGFQADREDLEFWLADLLVRSNPSVKQRAHFALTGTNNKRVPLTLEYTGRSPVNTKVRWDLNPTGEASIWTSHGFLNTLHAVPNALTLRFDRNALNAAEFDSSRGLQTTLVDGSTERVLLRYEQAGDSPR